jgi:16S rRNA pseudouridine516 synthase
MPNAFELRAQGAPVGNQPSAPGGVRLDKLLSNLGYGSRAEVKMMIHRGWVHVDGEVERREATKVDPEHVTLHREPLDHPGPLHLALHKPLGVSCSHDEREGPLVYELFPPRWQNRNPRIESVGRLDRETSGLLLLTDDHQLLHRLTSPKHHVEKRYVATLASEPPTDLVSMFASGTLMLEREETPCLPAVAEQISSHTVSVMLTEGRYHQVRRMFAAVGCHVEQLERTRVGEIELATLAPGEYRVLSEPPL